MDGTPPVVRVFSLVLRGVESSQPLLEALNEINGKIMFGRVLWASDRVIVSAEITATGIHTEQIAFVCLQIGALADRLNGADERHGDGAVILDAFFIGRRWLGR